MFFNGILSLKLVVNKFREFIRHRRSCISDELNEVVIWDNRSSLFGSSSEQKSYWPSSPNKLSVSSSGAFVFASSEAELLASSEAVSITSFEVDVSAFSEALTERHDLLASRFVLLVSVSVELRFFLY